MGRTYHERKGKHCVGCHIAKPWRAFQKHSQAADGHDSVCRKCRRDSNQRERGGDRPATPVQYQVEWYARMKAQKREYDAAYYQRNREKRLAQVAAWATANMERRRAADARRAARISQNGGWHTTVEWLALCASFGWRCVSCGFNASCVQQLTRDHVVPIVAGGTNDIGNLQPLCRTCNLAKGQQTIDYRPLRLAAMRGEEAAADD